MPDVHNAIVNNVLCYISSAGHSHNDLEITNSCEAFYKCDEIFTAKEIIYRYSDETPIRRCDNRISNDLSDLLV